MNKSLLFLLFILFIVDQASAQIEVGAKAGINWNSFRGNKAFDVVPGLTLGGFARYEVFDYLTAKGELLYMQQGANTIDYSVLPGDLDRHNTKVRFHSIQLPVIAEFGLPALADEPLRPKLSVGAFYAFNVYTRESYMNVTKLDGYQSVEYKGHTNLTKIFNRSQFGLIGALGADLTIMDWPVYMEFRYTHNMTPISKSETRGRFNLRETYNEWGNTLYLGTVSFNVAVTLQTF